MLAAHAAIAIENARLLERARELSVIEERNRLARDLHDSVVQKLFGIALTAQSAATLLDRSPTEAREQLERTQALAREAVGELRSIVFQLRPAAISATLFVSGIFNGLVNPSIHALFTLRAPPEIRARVLGALGTVLMLSSPVGLAVSGPVLSSAGPHPVLIGFAAVQTLAMTLVSVVSLRASPVFIRRALPARSSSP
jgi:hypothetical protein